MLALEEERAQVLGRVEQLKVHVKELEQQLQESAREVSLLQGWPDAAEATGAVWVGSERLDRP